MNHISQKSSIIFTGDNTSQIFEFCTNARYRKGKLSVTTTKGPEILREGDILMRGTVGFEINRS